MCSIEPRQYRLAWYARCIASVQEIPDQLQLGAIRFSRIGSNLLKIKYLPDFHQRALATAGRGCGLGKDGSDASWCGGVFEVAVLVRFLLRQ
jgi:hypothetical protein